MINTTSRRDVLHLDCGVVQLEVPSAMSSADFKDCSKWLKIVRRRAERAVQPLAAESASVSG